MVQLTRIYTKGGDKGKTSLGTKVRVLKSSPRIASIGDVDEANSFIGIARLHSEGEIDRLLSRIQNDLFDMGADLCIPEDKEGTESLRIKPSQVTSLEEAIDHYNITLPPLKSFVLPAGTPLSATLHQARTGVRRAERTVCSLNETEPLNPSIIHYLNRLSDLLFVLARYANHQEEGDILWVPGAHR
ncbi:MAG: cob(I)yrinic acid a,c-diamide adenosyltransferase [Proteobacteria bacterium]|nr:cob(I)yrinic acid a,c-diamide adenosyltransferase [Pseudomonadota bacterium]